MPSAISISRSLSPDSTDNHPHPSAMSMGRGCRIAIKDIQRNTQNHMAHCLLSSKEARELERDGKTPDCREHFHMPAKLAKAKVLDGTHRYAGPRDCRIVSCDAKEWAKAFSGGFAVMQMRRVFRTKRAALHGGTTAAGKHKAPRLKPGRSVVAA